MTISRRELIGKMAAAGVVGLAAGAGRAVASTSSTSPNERHGLPRGDESKVPPAPPEAEGRAFSHGAESPVHLAGEACADTTQAVDQGSLPQSGPPPWDLLRPLAMGSLVARGWRVAELSPVADGVCVLTLRNEAGRSHRVHLCRNDGAPQGIVYSERFDLLVMNGGQGDLPTDESLARAVAEVAHVLAANESGRRPREVVAELLPHAERLSRFAALDGSRLR